MAITQQARVLGFDPKVFYAAIGTAFPMFKQRFGADTEGVMGSGGWDPDDPKSKAFFEHHVAVMGQEPDRWASPSAMRAFKCCSRRLNVSAGSTAPP